MEPKDWIAISISATSLAVAFAAYHRTKRTAFGSVELDIVVKFNEARSRMTDVLLRMHEVTKGRRASALKAEERRHLANLFDVYDRKVEEYLNLINVVCGMYRDHKLDRKRFRAEYEPQLRELFDDDTPNVKARLHAVNTPYNPVRAVYREWFNREA